MDDPKSAKRKASEISEASAPEVSASASSVAPTPAPAKIDLTKTDQAVIRISKDLCEKLSPGFPADCSMMFCDARLIYSYVQNGTLQTRPKVYTNMKNIITHLFRILAANIKAGSPLHKQIGGEPEVTTTPVKDFGMMLPKDMPKVLRTVVDEGVEVQIVDASGEWEVSLAMPGHVQIRIPGLPPIIMRRCPTHALRLMIYLRSWNLNPREGFACSRERISTEGHTFIIDKDYVILDRARKAPAKVFGMNQTVPNMNRMQVALGSVDWNHMGCEVKHQFVNPIMYMLTRTEGVEAVSFRKAEIPNFTHDVFRRDVLEAMLNVYATNDGREITLGNGHIKVVRSGDKCIISRTGCEPISRDYKPDMLSVIRQALEHFLKR